LLAAEVEVAVGETEVFVGNLIVELERQDLGGIEDIECGGDDFNRAGGELRVLGSSQTGRDFASDANDILTAKFVGFFRSLGVFLGTENNLRHALAIAEVDEDEASMVAAGCYPAAECNFVAGVFGAEGIAMMGAVGHGSFKG
jgi:hypothetical protein